MSNSARQHARAAVAKITAADFANGVQTNLFTKLPNGVIPTALSVLIVVPFNTGTTDVLDIGNEANGAAYANDVNLKAAAGTRVAAATLPGLINTEDGGLQLTATRTEGGTAPTEGEALVLLEYLELDVEQFSQG